MDIFNITTMKLYQRSRIIIWLEDFVYNIVIRIMRVAIWVIDKQKQRNGENI
jgi:hypothetical protein